MSGRFKLQIKLSPHEAQYLQKIAEMGNMSLSDLMLRSTRYVVAEMQKSAKDKTQEELAKDELAVKVSDVGDL